LWSLVFFVLLTNVVETLSTFRHKDTCHMITTIGQKRFTGWRPITDFCCSHHLFNREIENTRTDLCNNQPFLGDAKNNSSTCLTQSFHMSSICYASLVVLPTLTAPVERRRSSSLLVKTLNKLILLFFFSWRAQRLSLTALSPLCFPDCGSCLHSLTV
jgi:hypothetical protein